MRTASFIDGRFGAPSAAAAPVFDPATGDPVASVTEARAGDVDAAIAAARRAFDAGPWPRTPPFERGTLLRQIAARIQARADEIAQLEARTAGKPIAGARREIAGAARVFTYYAGAADKMFGATIPISDDVLDLTLREPLGVVAQIVPWNFPFLAAAWKLAPALAAGCTMVLKPSPLTPLTALLLAEILAECGLPPGVVNVLAGGREVGETLVAHQAVDGVSFTGSSAVGSAVMRAAAAAIKPVALELGGKNATIVFADADLGRAATSALGAAFGNAGQSCSARSRLLVERQALDAFTETFVAAARTLRAGPTLDPATTLGPLISAAHWSAVDGHVRTAAAAGARLLCGGGRPRDAPDRGHFYAPTIFADVAPESALFRDEVFGPVCSVTAFDTDEEAIRLVNASEYGLAGSVWTRDIGRALRTARRMRLGMVAVNGLPSASSQSLFAPFGGTKRSGLGRELGMDGLAFYTEIKNVFVDLA